ncbi:uncharacterized protein LOC116993041 [Catharus ustulatus]|uniref:uncharacterized protein LOC116993041 n=1 Tax=Catharus ustulatus TaxID=91951 RepID=UPI00140E6E01|nr:uncharacterized protein LOC116993041 [Catharus ustulatus]XP_032909174.1 uncharacterized protein LOC116993041 [Catharus ustulatus]
MGEIMSPRFNLRFTQMFLCSILSSIALGNGADLPMIQPKENIWESLANAAGLDTICLTHSRPKKPFSTCLVGLPVKDWPIPKDIPAKVLQVMLTPVDAWRIWTQFLPVAPFEPQELEILGSMKMDFCIKFSFLRVTKNKMVDVTPNHDIYRNASSWCNYTKISNKPSLQVPVQLPRGIFFICGDRIWPAIPANIKGGPCSIGRLSLLTPNLKILREQKHTGKSLTKQYDPDCDDSVYTWNKAQRNEVAIFSSQAASGEALTQLDHMGCWLSKHTCAISLALSDMLTDVDSVRQAALQNRAAIDDLLLTHGHGCEEFEGMCCMNLSDHSKSIRENIRQLQEGVAKLGEVTGSWLDGVFDFFGLSPLWKELLKIGFYVFVGLVILLLILLCIFQCVQQAVTGPRRRWFWFKQEGRCRNPGHPSGCPGWLEPLAGAQKP